MNEETDKTHIYIENTNCNVNVFQAGSCPTIYQSAADKKDLSVDDESSFPASKDAEVASPSPLTAAQALAMEVMNGVVVDRLALEKFIHSLSSCYTALDVGVQVINLMVENPTIQKEQVVSRLFIKSMMTFAVQVKTGGSVSNLQRKINFRYEEAKRKKLLP